jgi:hypothetical protein
MNLRNANFEMVGFILAKSLHNRTGCGSPYKEARRVEAGLPPQRDSRFPRKCSEKSLPCSLKTRFPIALERHTEVAINDKAPLTLGHACRYGHNF